MRTATIVFLILSASFTLMGLIPCLGFLNWLGIPCSAACALLGLIGTTSKETPEKDKQVHLAALIIGVCLIGIGAIRCLLGGGVV